MEVEAGMNSNLRHFARVFSLSSLTIPLLVLFVLSPPAFSQEKALPAAEKYFTNVELTNQKGERVRLYQDILKNRVIVINTFFASCTSACPPLNRNMERIQEAFAENLGKDLFLVSITVDPVNDTPEKLSEYAKKYNAREGWLFLTGTKENVDFALKKLGQYVEKKEEHSTILIIGNEKTGLWKKAFGLAKAEELIKVVESVLKDPVRGAKPNNQMNRTRLQHAL